MSPLAPITVIASPIGSPSGSPVLFTCGVVPKAQIRSPVVPKYRVVEMAPQALWSGSLRLSLVLIPVRLFAAVSSEDAVSFRMIHKPSGKPIRYLKGIETDRGFKGVPEDEIVKGYEHSKGNYVLLKPEELDELKLEAKHTINLERFVDRATLDSRYFEKPYYLLPDGDEADEGYTVMRDALAKTGKVAIGQLIMQGRQHLVGIASQGKGLLLEILRYAQELRDPEPYFEKITAEPAEDATAMAAQLIERQSGKFEPKKMPNEYAKAVKELVRPRCSIGRQRSHLKLRAVKRRRSSTSWLRSKRACRPRAVRTCAMR